MVRYIKVSRGAIFDSIEWATGYIDNSNLDYEFFGGSGGGATSYLVNPGDWITQIRIGFATYNNDRWATYMKIYTHFGDSLEIKAGTSPSDYKMIGYNHACVFNLRTRYSGYIAGIGVYYFNNFYLDVSSIVGGWAFVKSYNPTHETTTTETITVGVSSTTETSSSNSWGVAVTAAYQGIAFSGEASANYEGYLNTGCILIETSQREMTKTITI